MKIVNVFRLCIARAFGLVHGVMRWAIALRILGGWCLVGRDPRTSPWITQRDPWSNPRPLLLPIVRTTRRVLASLEP